MNLRELAGRSNGSERELQIMWNVLNKDDLLGPGFFVDLLGSNVSEVATQVLPRCHGADVTPGR
jgi:hypothetical protein